ncbi:MAG: MxaK protein [Gammaproteobacteria bacterium]|nr:MxaK protein [Gammaproteobacteria bacterium]
MALTRKFGLSVLAVGLILACLVALVFQGLTLQKMMHFNRALPNVAVTPNAVAHTAQANFARAYALQQAQEFEAALRAYAGIAPEPHSRLEAAIDYNIANLHLQRALIAFRAEQSDVAVPLVALAKQAYRDLLRNHPTHWDAKYNLELSLRLLPDLPEHDPAQERNPERAPRSTGAVEAYRRLP